MSEIRIDATSDWHVGHPNGKHEYPTTEEIQLSLQKALEEGVDAYIIAGDIVNKGSAEFAQYTASIIRPYVEQGLTVIGVSGNHDLDLQQNIPVTHNIFSDNGIIMLEGESYVLTDRDNTKKLTIVGVSGETGDENNKWWENPEGREAGWDKAIIESIPFAQSLNRELHQSVTEDVLVVTHRGIIADTVGTAAKRGERFSPEVAHFEPIINHHRRQGKRITVVHGHDHTANTDWEGFPEGLTKEGVVVYNVAAPLRRRLGEHLTKRLQF